MSIINDAFNPSTTIGTVVSTAQLAMQAATLGCSIVTLKNTTDIKNSMNKMTSTVGANHDDTTARLNAIYKSNADIAMAAGVPNAHTMGQPTQMTPQQTVDFPQPQQQVSASRP